MNRPLPIAGALILTSLAFGQTDANLSFEVATVKKSEPVNGRGGAIAFAFGRRGGPGTEDPGRITWSGVTLKDLLTTAYDVKRYQVNGPAWLDAERYDIVARVPAGATKEQVNVMWRNLIAERFGVALHRASKVFDLQEMVAAKGGVKLKETSLDPNAPQAPQSPGPPPGAMIAFAPGPGGPPPGGLPPGGPPPGGPPPGAPQLDKNGVPQLTSPGIIMMMTMGASGPTARMVGKAQTLAQLATMLGNQLNHPVVDKTGLTAKYDFVLEFAPDFGGGGIFPPGGLGPGPGAGPAGDTSAAPNASEPGGSNLIAALQQQLGLRLVSNKAPLDVLVIDKAEKSPTEN